MIQTKLSDGSFVLRNDEGDDLEEGSVHAIWLFPGIGLRFIDIVSPHWSSMEISGEDTEFSENSFALNYAVSGSSKLLFEKDRYIILKQGDISFSSRFEDENFFFPEGFYQGIQFIIDPVMANRSIGFTAPEEIPNWFRLNFQSIFKKYNAKGRTRVSACPLPLRTLLTELWTMIPARDELPLMTPEAMASIRVQTIRFFQMLQYSASPFVATHRPTFHGHQLLVSEQVTFLLRDNLQHDYTLAELSSQLGVSETSLKRYFQQLYGCSVAKYQRNLRMDRAAELLSSPEHRAMSVLDVALEVGYENQSKFAAVFKRQFETSPLEYKKKALL